jgi:hypothetical protein
LAFTPTSKDLGGSTKTPPLVEKKAVIELEIHGEMVKNSPNITKNEVGEGQDNDLSLLTPPYERDYTNPSVEIENQNREQGVADLTQGAGEEVESKQYTVEYCEYRISTNHRIWTIELQRAKQRESESFAK